MRKKIKAKVSAPKKVRAATYIDESIWLQIQEEAIKAMTTESHIMRILLSKGLEHLHTA